MNYLSLYFIKNVLKHSIKGQHMQFSLSSVTYNKHSAQWTIILFIGSDILPYLNWFSPFLSCFFFNLITISNFFSISIPVLACAMQILCKFWNNKMFPLKFVLPENISKSLSLPCIRNQWFCPKLLLKY